ncbi:MFS general substrate transporter [Dichomitus squalens LYAD-421 SS1]|uniref:MFS general substrate transporter n=1 Tax=Dichomitus squalens TaxID=114155 RepID=A0A4Q9PUB6_9APHY|nr:MFS general substrate transporter [Dichomitus squalens LYAD-421 SS1]EJF67464.1 MFS general substrate transporter [Dichomitus squalens LYAD-421 SS1]TBU58127.1 MFS general substrate transporter [Dichomitus squalens]
MTFGILDDNKLEKVPGTGLLSDQGIVHGHEVAIDEAKDLKRGVGKYAHVVLIPQPSDDPRDPLNWPTWKKEACFWTLAFAASLDGALSPMVGPGYTLLAKQFDVSVDDVTSSFGFILLGLGTFMLVQNALAVKFGHRIVYLLSLSLMFISCIWCALSPNLASIRASRVFQGFGMSALQTLVASTIEQIYCVHERGSRSVIWSFSIMAGITLGPLICSYVIQNISWEFGFWFVSIPLGLNTLAVFFFVPESTFDRNTAKQSRDEDSASSEKPFSDAEIESVGRSSAAPPPVPSYMSSLKIWSGTYTDESIWRLSLRPFPFLLSPVTWFLFLTQGLQTVWLSLVPLCSSTIFTLEYNFNATQTGLTNLGGLVGIVLAMAVTGPLNDWGIVWLSKRNRGVYEPEFRLVFMSSMLCGVFGYVGWAVGNDHHMPWIGAVACITMLNFSIVVSGSASVTYLLDTHRANALHVFALSNFGKNMVLYASTFFANGIILSRGVKVSLLILGACQAACWAASVPMYIYGKRVRSFIARHPQLFQGDLPASDLVSKETSKAP